MKRFEFDSHDSTARALRYVVAATALPGLVALAWVACEVLGEIFWLPSIVHYGDAPSQIRRHTDKYIPLDAAAYEAVRAALVNAGYANQIYGAGEPDEVLWPYGVCFQRGLEPA